MKEAVELKDSEVMKKYKDYLEVVHKEIKRMNPDNKPYKFVIEDKLPYGVSENTLMSVSQLIKFLEPYPDYKVVSDSGWECSETDVSVAFINHQYKHIVLTQHTDWQYDTKNGWELLFNIEKENDL